MPPDIASPPQLIAFASRLAQRKQPLFATLATLAPNNIACARTVVLRGIADDTAWLSTHAGADKVSHLRHHPDAELLLWLPEKQLQLRLRATWRVIDSIIAARNPALAEKRNAAWQTHSPASRQMFTWPAPGHPLKRQRKTPPAPSLAPPHDFALLLGVINFIDALLLSKPVHQRFLHQRRRRSWNSSRITP